LDKYREAGGLAANDKYVFLMDDKLAEQAQEPWNWSMAGTF
jgi:hypothetical protein